MTSQPKKMIAITKKQARQFMFRKHGLLGEPIFHGKEGILAFVKQVSCIQYDPIDVCGRNADLVLFSRVPGYTKAMLSELLYQDRTLFDYFDKNLAIMRIEQWPNAEKYREWYKTSVRRIEALEQVKPCIAEAIKQKGAVCSKDLELSAKVDWYWGSTRISRAALETMYFQGDLVIHHKVRNQKYYALAQDIIPPHIYEQKKQQDHESYIADKILQRIEAVGLLWNKPSDAFLGILGMKANDRKLAFSTLAKQGHITPVMVDEFDGELWMSSKDLPLLHEVMKRNQWLPRVEFLAPLDNMLWDRKLIRSLFGFDYKWEIYTPPQQRKFGYYILPMINQDGFAGRIEIVQDRKQQCLQVKNIWLEADAKLYLPKLEETIQRMAKFLECRQIQYYGTVKSMLDQAWS